MEEPLLLFRSVGNKEVRSDTVQCANARMAWLVAVVVAVVIPVSARAYADNGFKFAFEKR